MNKKTTKSLLIRNAIKTTQELSDIKKLLIHKLGISEEQISNKSTPLDILRALDKYLRDVNFDISKQKKESEM